MSLAQLGELRMSKNAAAARSGPGGAPTGTQLLRDMQPGPLSSSSASAIRKLDRINHHGFLSAQVHMAGRLPAPVEAHRPNGLEPVHPVDQIRFGRLEHQLVVVSYQHVLPRCGSCRGGLTRRARRTQRRMGTGGQRDRMRAGDRSRTNSSVINKRCLGSSHAVKATAPKRTERPPTELIAR